MLYRLTLLFFTFLLLAGWTAAPSALAAEATFTDTRFQGDYSTENLDAIIEEYQLYDGWYWSTPLRVYQDFHGQEEKKGWTQTSMERFDPFYYSWGWFGCRWNWDELNDSPPNKYGWGECFGFCQFLGYLLSGERNPHRDWVTFKSMNAAHGLKPGDILRVEFTDEKGEHYHSAMVYDVDEEKGQVRFVQVSGSNYNRIYTRRGFTGAGLAGTMKLSAIAACPGLRVLRSKDNLDPADEPKSTKWTVVTINE